MIYSMGEISPDVRQKPVRDKGKYKEGQCTETSGSAWECDWVVGSQILTYLLILNLLSPISILIISNLHSGCLSFILNSLCHLCSLISSITFTCSSDLSLCALNSPSDFPWIHVSSPSPLFHLSST